MMGFYLYYSNAPQKNLSQNYQFRTHGNDTALASSMTDVKIFVLVISGLPKEIVSLDPYWKYVCVVNIITRLYPKI